MKSSKILKILRKTSFLTTMKVYYERKKSWKINYNFCVCFQKQNFCTTEQKSCPDSNTAKLFEGWKIPVYVSNSQQSEVLQSFLDTPLPKFEKNYQEIITECQRKKFQFPLFPEHLGQNHLERHDESSDSIFYNSPRFVTHIDDFAIESLMNYYEEKLKNDMKILDLCSSWISHLPNTLKFNSVIGLGMNEAELEKNKKLTKVHIQDLNKNPILKKFKSDSLDAVLCTVSIDYLIRPFEVFNEIHRILKPGGSFIVSFSNRMFATKVIKAWRFSGDDAHVFIATFYFQTSADWAQVTISDITQKTQSSSDRRDPMYVLHGIKKN